MKIDIPKFLLFVMTAAAAVAADISSSPLATKLTIEEEKSMLINEERGTTTTTTPEEFAASSLLSLSLPLSLVDANTVVVDRTSENGDSGGRFSPNGINNLRVVVDTVGSSSKTGTMHNTVADAVVSDILLEKLPADSDGGFSVVDPVTRGDGSSSKTGTMHHTVADAGVSVVLLKTDSGGRFSPNGINNLRVVVDPVNHDDGLSSMTGTMHHTVADAAVPEVSLETLSVDDGGRFSPSGSINHHAVDDVSSFSGTDGGDVFAQRKLIKSSKKVKYPEALCTLSLFANSFFMYAKKCFTDIMVTISTCDDKDDMCYISEHLPSLPQEEQEEQEENQEEEQCFVGGSFPAKENIILYNPSTGDCEFLYVDLVDDPCNSYLGDTGTGSLGLKARINVKNNPDVMFIQFTKDKGLTFYNDHDERVAKKHSPTHNIDRYLRQEGATKPVLSMMPHPFASRRLYYKVALKNDTPYEANSARIEYCSCAKDDNNFIASGGTWTADTYRGGCLVTEIHSTLIIDGREEQCSCYFSTGTGLSEFFLMWINDVCCLRSSEQSNTECTNQYSGSYQKVTIRNDTPFDTQYNINNLSLRPYVRYDHCSDHWSYHKDYIQQVVVSGQTWEGPTRGSCLLRNISQVSLSRSQDEGGNLDCTNYVSSGTAYLQFFIIMYDGKCCVRSSAQSKECP